MMSVTPSTGSLVQALIGQGQDNGATAADQPNDNAAGFAAMIAGLGIVPQATETDASGTATDPQSDDTASDDAAQDGGDQQDAATTPDDPLAAALAMLPAAVAQAAVTTNMAGGDAGQQPSASVSGAALAKLAVLQGQGGTDPNADDTTASDTKGTAQALPPALAALLANAKTAKAAAATSGDTTATATGTAAPTSGAPNLAAVVQQAQATTKASGSDATDAKAAASDAKRKSDDDAVAALRATDGTSTSGATAAASQQNTDTFATAKADAPVAQTPVGQALANHTLNMTNDGQWLDQLARDIATTASPEGKISFALNPQHLGSLQVEVTRGAEGASVRLTADTDAARNILIDAQPKLEAEARAQGVKIAETHVDLGGQNAQGQGQRQQAAQAQPFVRTVRADLGAAAAITDTGSGSGAGGAAAERYA